MFFPLDSKSPPVSKTLLDTLTNSKGSPHGVMVNVLDSEIAEFELQSHYYIYFRTMAFYKGYLFQVMS